jgi:hypothetical protein
MLIQRQPLRSLVSDDFQNMMIIGFKTGLSHENKFQKSKNGKMGNLRDNL